MFKVRLHTGVGEEPRKLHRDYRNKRQTFTKTQWLFERISGIFLEKLLPPQQTASHAKERMIWYSADRTNRNKEAQANEGPQVLSRNVSSSDTVDSFS